MLHLNKESEIYELRTGQGRRTEAQLHISMHFTAINHIHTLARRVKGGLDFQGQAEYTLITVVLKRTWYIDGNL